MTNPEPKLADFEDLHEWWITLNGKSTFEDFIEEVQKMSIKHASMFETRKMVPDICTVCQWQYIDEADRERHIRGDAHLVKFIALLQPEELSYGPTA